MPHILALLALHDPLLGLMTYNYMPHDPHDLKDIGYGRTFADLVSTLY